MTDLLCAIESRRVVRGLCLWWLGGPSCVLKTADAVVYIDLFTGPAPTGTAIKLSRAMPDLVEPQKISIADIVLSTHEHVDHCHRESLWPIYENTRALFVGAPSSARHFRKWGIDEKRIVELRPMDRMEHLGIKVRAMGSKDCADMDAVTFLIEIGGVQVFEGGDTLYTEELKEFGRMAHIDIALLNFFANPTEGGPKQSMEPSEVAQAALDLGASVLITKHWDIWRELRGDPDEVGRLLRSSPVNFVALRQGEEFSYEGRRSSAIS